MEMLIDGEVLEPIYKDHSLQGEWKDFRDCHIEGDWVLIYRLHKGQGGEEIITFCATDNHSNLFK
jgi:mRNA interferase YafQ